MINFVTCIGPQFKIICDNYYFFKDQIGDKEATRNKPQQREGRAGMDPQQAAWCQGTGVGKCLGWARPPGLGWVTLGPSELISPTENGAKVNPTSLPAF